MPSYPSLSRSSLLFASTRRLNPDSVYRNDLVSDWESWLRFCLCFAAIIITRSTAALNLVTPINRVFFNTVMRLRSAQSECRIRGVQGVCVWMWVGVGVGVCAWRGVGARQEKHKQRAESPLAAKVLLPQHESPSVCYHI